MLATENSNKAVALADSFFPPPPDTPIIPNTTYPEPLQAKGIFSRKDICAAIKKLKVFKASGKDGIQNIILQKCVDTIIDHLYYIYRAILKLVEYPSCWLIILTIVLCETGKMAYNVTKSYHPISLLNTLGKLFLMLVAADLFSLAEKHNLLPPTQFGDQPGRCTTDTMHLVAQKIKDAWRKKNVTSILFLDIQAAFPNTVKDHLLHNMKTRHVPAPYIRLFDHLLSNQQTQLGFDNFLSNPIDISNGDAPYLCFSMHSTMQILLTSHRGRMNSLQVL